MLTFNNIIAILPPSEVTEKTAAETVGFYHFPEELVAGP